MKWTGSFVTAGSGSIAGCVFSRNRAGAYIRSKVVPVNPGSTFQNLARTALAEMIARWTSILTPTQRAAWDAWAYATEKSGWGGSTYKMTGQNAYTGMNSIRRQIEFPIIDSAPIVYTGAVMTPPILTIADVSDQLLSYNINVADPWAVNDESVLLCFQGRPQNKSVNYFKGPYRFAGYNSGNSGAPLTNPRTAAASFPFALGQRVHCQFRAMYYDGRLSSITRSNIIATT